MAQVSAVWTSPTGGQCVATGSGGHTVVLDARAGRTGVDLTSILAKQREHVTSIDIVFTVRGKSLDRRAVDRALDLALKRYCSVGATLAGVVAISHHAEIEQDEPVAAVA